MIPWLHRTRAGIFGCAVAIATTAGHVEAQSAQDDSPHRVAFVSVDGVRVPYLDWHGSGPAVVFIPGFGNSAHVFDDFGPRFTDRHRVLAVTRIGFGESDQPDDNGYALSARVEHLRAALDSAGIERAVLIGHSLGGDEITAFAVAYPARTVALVYLDAAYDHVEALKWEEALGEFFQYRPGPVADDLATAHGLQAYLSRVRGVEFPLGEVLANFRFDSTGAVAGQRTGSHVYTNLVAATSPPEFARIQVPVLALYSRETTEKVMPWLGSDSAAFARADSIMREIDVLLMAARASFQEAVPRALVYWYPAHHYQFLAAPQDTEARIRRFLATLDER